ncbi:HAD-IA family hydrolase [Roseobacter sp. CCS2]|uniref:HAD-IA family hydrolase n=1 Tax=Roseobacter sp. CCS2 TaxID=391593 RepID=UPI0000F3F165|nr:HAD-IA family hydrolase [Roseobacter sp. CCS2]EBA11172.1 Haloacid dehalogenase-like hydrolase [Roseobacter sp. CCS2]
MDKRAIIFGSIGTIVETSAMQREAFNQSFAEADLDWHWSEEEYISLLKKSGGRQRIADYANAKDADVSASALHNRKTEIFNEMMVKEGLKPRPGVLPLIRFAKEQDMKLGFATTTSNNNICAIFDALEGALHRSTFDFVGDADEVAKSKPDPEIYYRAMTALTVNADQCLAIEDTAVSMQAATAAGIACVAFPGAYAGANNFEDAYRIVDQLDPHLLPVLTSDAER